MGDASQAGNVQRRQAFRLRAVETALSTRSMASREVSDLAAANNLTRDTTHINAKKLGAKPSISLWHICGISQDISESKTF